MKTLWQTLLFVFVAIFMCNTLYAQTIYIVNPTGVPAGVNVHTTLQSAVDAASDGDIIYLMPNSATVNLDLTKRLTLIGSGFYNPVRIGLLNLKEGASGSIIDGIHITGYIYIDAHLSGIAIRNCVFEGGAGHHINLAVNRSINGLVINNNIFRGHHSAIYLGSSSSNHSNVIVQNNLIRTNGTGINAGNGTVIRNNIFLGMNTGWMALNIRDSIVENNIFYAVAVSSGVYTSSFRNNISSLGNFDFIGSNGNFGSDNVVTDPMFEDLEESQVIWIPGWNLNLLPGSPAIGVGTDGTDIGLFGGPNPFNNNGTSLPEIYELTAPLYIQQDQDLPVQIKARGN
jgi:hypothetical protein